MSDYMERVDSDGYPMSMNDLWREWEADKMREEREKRLEGHIPYESDRCPCDECRDARFKRYEHMDC